MRFLITGGAGFIGSHFVEQLLDGGEDVTVLDKLTYAGHRVNLPSDHARLRVVEGDVCDRSLVRDVLPGHDAVVHFAAESHVDRSVASGEDFVRTNVGGTQVLLEAAVGLGVPRFVQVSTDEVYGSIERGRWDENQPLLPNSPYAASKASADLLARSYWRTHGLDVSITRCSNNYGPRQHPEKMIPRFLTALLGGGSVPLYGRGDNVREWLHVADHCRAVDAVLRRGRAGRVYNVGGGTELTNLELTHRLLALCGAGTERITYVTDRLGHDLRYAVDDTRIRTELGWSPRVSFAEGLEDTVRWYCDHPSWWTATAAPAARTSVGPVGSHS